MDDDGNLIIARPKISGKIKLTYDEDKETERAMEVDADAYMAELRGQVGRAIPLRDYLLLSSWAMLYIYLSFVLACCNALRSSFARIWILQPPSTLFGPGGHSLPPTVRYPHLRPTYLPSRGIAPFSFYRFRLQGKRCARFCWVLGVGCGCCYYVLLPHVAVVGDGSRPKYCCRSTQVRW